MQSEVGCLWSIVSLPPAFNRRCPFVKKIRFLESPGNFSGPESCYVFVGFAFKMKVSIINFLKIIQVKHQLSKQFGLVCGLGIVLIFNGFDLKICLRARKVSGSFEKRSPWPGSGCLNVGQRSPLGKSLSSGKVLGKPICAML